MPHLPYRTLMHQKRWATDGLCTVIAENFDRIPTGDQVIILQLLDHIHAVDEIFSHNLEGRPHGYQAPRSTELPLFGSLARDVRAVGERLADYADALTPEMAAEPIDFLFSNGEPASMTRGEMLLHVATHGAGHRGQIALLLQKNGIQPFPDRMTDFVATREEEC